MEELQIRPPRNVQIIKGNLIKTAFRKQINRKGT